MRSIQIVLLRHDFFQGTWNSFSAWDMKPASAYGQMVRLQTSNYNLVYVESKISSLSGILKYCTWHCKCMVVNNSSLWPLRLGIWTGVWILRGKYECEWSLKGALSADRLLVAHKRRFLQARANSFPLLWKWSAVEITYHQMLEREWWD